MNNKYIIFNFLAFLTFFSSPLYGQWTEHRTPVGRHISSFAFVGDQVFAQLTFPNSTAFEKPLPPKMAEPGPTWLFRLIPYPRVACANPKQLSRKTGIYTMSMPMDGLDLPINRTMPANPGTW